MSDKTLAQKLQVKPSRSLLVVNPPENYAAMLGPLPEGAKVLSAAVEPADIVQVFVKDRRELERQLPKLKTAIKPGGMVWVTYYKGTSKIKSDIHRDSINAYAHSLGMEGVAMVSIDDDWSALRLKVAG